MPQQETTPVLLLVFNRPETTAQVFSAVREARPARLYVAADGPREQVPGEDALCSQTREVVARVDWPCEVHTLFRDRNLGCRNAVNSALDWFFGLEPEGIILEDDCLPGQDFFGYAQALLERYREEDRVAMICGTNYLLDQLAIEESYCFSRYFSIWGWASWRRVWALHDQSMGGWPAFRDSGGLAAYYPQPYMQRHVRKTYDLAASGKIDTWDIQFSFSCLSRNMLAAVPKVNLISNIGYTGTHTSDDARNHFLPVFPLPTEALIHPVAIQPEPRYDNAFFRREFGPHPVRGIRGLFRRALRRVKRTVR